MAVTRKIEIISVMISIITSDYFPYGLVYSIIPECIPLSLHQPPKEAYKSLNMQLVWLPRIPRHELYTVVLTHILTIHPSQEPPYHAVGFIVSILPIHMSDQQLMIEAAEEAIETASTSVEVYHPSKQ